MSTLPVDDIRTDGGTQARAGLNKVVVADYVEAMQDGAVFPAIVVFHDAEGYWLADGFHRTEAARRLGLLTIAAEVREGGRQDAILYACGANQAHGLRRSRDDKRAAARLAIATFPEWSSRKLAEAVGVSHTFIDGLRDGKVSSAVMREALETMKNATEIIAGGNVASDEDLELVTQADELIKEAIELQAKELKDETLPTAHWAEQKRVGEKAVAQARAYALMCECELGRMLNQRDALGASFAP